MLQQAFEHHLPTFSSTRSNKSLAIFPLNARKMQVIKISIHQIPENLSWNKQPQWHYIEIAPK